MFELGEHRLFSIDRSTLANQQALSQVLLIEGFKHIFSWRRGREMKKVSAGCNKLHSG